MSSILFLSSLALAQEVEFHPELQVRPRFEVDSVRGSDVSGELVSFVNMRSRLGVGLSHEDLAVRVVVSDVRYMGEATDSRRSFSANGLDVRIATATWSPGPLQLTVGRMEEPLLNQRLLAINAWRPEGRVFDGVRALWRQDAVTVDVRAHLLDEGDTVELDVTEQATPGGMDSLLGVASFQYRTDPISVAPNVLVQSAPDLFRTTMGVLTRGAAGTLDYSVEGYYQLGEADDAALAAGMVGAEFGLTPIDSLRLALATDVLSGDDDLTDDRSTAFNPLYGANHKYYGLIDMALFYTAGPRDGQGLVDTVFRSQWTSGATTLRWDQHLFLAPVPADGTILAVEPDLQIRQRVTDGLAVSGGTNLWFPLEAETSFEFMTWLQFDARL